MACLQIPRVGLSLALRPWASLPRHRCAEQAALCLSCCLPEDGDGGDSSSNEGEERPESLFTKELRRRGMAPAYLLEDKKRGEVEVVEDVSGGRTRRNDVTSATDYAKALSSEREQSMALNSEGLEGLIPRAKLLLTIGGTFFFGFWPLILITFVLFGALYLYFGPSFVHDASKMPLSPPPYVDPCTLLEEEKLSQVAPYVK